MSLRPPLLQVPQDHGIYAKTKAGAVQVPEKFLNQSDAGRKAAAERAEKALTANVTEPAAAKQTEAKEKTKKKAAAVEAVAADAARKAAAERAKKALTAKVTEPAAAKQTEATEKTKKKAAAVEAVAAEQATCYEVLAKAEQAAPSKEGALVKQFVPCLPAVLNACGSGRRSELCSWASTSIY